MGFYFRLAPGMRIRVSSRGLRASVGPRAARLYVGAGGSGLSTGAGPVTLYRSAGGGRRGGGRAGAPAAPRASGAPRRTRWSPQVDQARQLAAAFDHVLNLHRAEYPTSGAPLAPLPDPVDGTAIRRRRERDALRGLGIFRRSARAAARARAREYANWEIEQETSRRQREHARLQHQLDLQWHRLLTNDPEVVLATLAEAFDDNAAFAAPVGVHGNEAAIVVLAPEQDLVPERMPKVTGAGRLSLARLAQSERNAYYTLLLCGHVLATVRETFAVAPGIDWVRVAAVRRVQTGSAGTARAECLLAVLFRREALGGIDWDSTDAAAVVNVASSERSMHQGPAGELRPLDLTCEPALAAMIAAMEFDEAPDGGGGQPRFGKAPLPAGPPPPWRPRPGWGTVRDFAAIPNVRGGIDVRCRFVPDDGGAPVEIDLPDTVIPELGEFARGVMLAPDQLAIRVPASMMADVERTVFRRINAMEPMKRALMYADSNGLYEDCGWTWTADYRLVKAAPGLIPIT